MSDSLAARTLTITGFDDAEIEAYLAQPDGAPPGGGVVVIHHMPGYDRATKEITRRFAELGYDAICPNLHWRAAPGAAPDDAAAASRVAGGVPDERPELAQILTANGKEFDFHSYPDAGHAFFAVDRSSYRVAAANDGGQRVAAFYAAKLAS